MENKRKALGKGLEDLFSGGNYDLNEFEEEIAKNTPENEIQELNLSELRVNPYQPRKDFDDEKLDELAQSIKEHGVIQPIIVKKSSIKGYEIVAGERRYRASKKANLKTIPAIVKDFTDQEMMEIALLENLQREDLNAIEEANAYDSLIKSLNLTQEELAKKLGKSRSHITNILGLLNLSNKVKKMVIDGKITAGHARVLSKIKEDEADFLVDKVISENLSVRDLEKLSQDKKVEKKNKITRTKKKAPIYIDLENKLEDKLGTKVNIKSKKIEINYSGKNDLERILEILEVL